MELQLQSTRLLQLCRYVVLLVMLVPQAYLLIPFGFLLPSLWPPYGVALDSLCLPFGFPLASLLIPFGFAWPSLLVWVFPRKNFERCTLLMSCCPAASVATLDTWPVPVPLASWFGLQDELVLLSLQQAPVATPTCSVLQ